MASNTSCGTVKGTSTYEVKKCELTWIVDNYSEHEGKIESPTIRCAVSKTKWQFVLHPKGDGSEGSKGHVSLFVRLIAPEVPAGNHVKATFSIVDAQGQSCYAQETEAMDARNVEHFCLIKFVKLEDLSNESSRLLPDDRLTVKVELKFSFENLSTDVLAHQAEAQAPSTDGLLKLSSDFQELYRRQAFTDITLRADGREYQLHRCILSARSPILYKVLQFEMEGKVQNFMEIPNVEYPVIEAMIEYFYTGRLDDLSPDLMLGLYSVAHTYRLTDLLRICRSFLISNLNLQSVCDILIMAEGHSDPDLQSQWNALTRNNPTLAVRILSQCFAKNQMDLQRASASST